MIPYMINQGIHEIMDKVTNEPDMQYITLVYYKDRLMCEIDRMYKYEHMTGSEPAQQLDIRRKINDMGHVIETIDTSLTDKLVDDSHKSISLKFSELTARLKNMK